jgi:FKBP-type peptidyl-prolyl cis-trans isomerase FklB
MYVDRIVKGWTYILQNMPSGSKWEVYIPYHLAYGEKEAGQIKPYSDLLFTIELIKIVK